MYYLRPSGYELNRNRGGVGGNAGNAGRYQKVALGDSDYTMDSNNNSNSSAYKPKTLGQVKNQLNLEDAKNYRNSALDDETVIPRAPQVHNHL